LPVGMGSTWPILSIVILLPYLYLLSATIYH